MTVADVKEVPRASNRRFGQRPTGGKGDRLDPPPRGGDEGVGDCVQDGGIHMDRVSADLLVKADYSDMRRRMYKLCRDHVTNSTVQDKIVVPFTSSQAGRREPVQEPGPFLRAVEQGRKRVQRRIMIDITALQFGAEPGKACPVHTTRRPAENDAG